MTLRATPRQLDILRDIEAYRSRYGCSPSLREIGASLGIKSTNGVNDHMAALERKGLIDRGADGRARQLRLTASGRLAITSTSDDWRFVAEAAIEALDLSA